jgi:C4-dicarboxylate-specific signal transduction histidine kinase
MDTVMSETHFAPAGRCRQSLLAQQVQTVTSNPVIDAVMTSVGGLLAVINEQRQILAVNALEACMPGEEIRLEASSEENGIQFSVWNPQTIPPDVALRIFQRNFTTKAGAGRGLGTYAMKLFGEEALGGRVAFDTGAGGTTFHLQLPT